VEFSKLAELAHEQSSSKQNAVLEESGDQTVIVVNDDNIDEREARDFTEIFDSWEDFDFVGLGEQESVPEDFEWTRKSTRRLLKRYLAGDTIYEIADRLELEPSVAMTQLVTLLLKTKGALVDDSAERFGQTWTEEDFAILDRLWKLNVGISKIAKALCRDQLGVAFVIFARHSPSIPEALVKDFKLK
jgi:hypothetical protein